MKKLSLLLFGIFLLGAVTVFYQEFKTRNFVEYFIASSNNLEDVVHGITIWEETDENSSSSIAILRPGDEKYEEVLSALSSWEVRRALFKEMDLTKKLYKLDIVNDNRPMDPFDILITTDGMLNIHGEEYELVSGSSIEEITDLAK
ncbi:MAG TPA: hypothetical protein VNS08_11220 [Ureibacillus sp.]|nr:hypothetical protein [Ureibacillus sp.]